MNIIGLTFSQILSFLIFIILFCIDFIFALFIKNENIKENPDRSFYILSSSIIIILLISIIINYYNHTILPSEFFYIGIILMLFGELISISGILSLNKYFSTIVTVYKNHKVINKGPYKFVRHPIYSGAILIFIGLFLSIRNLFSIPLILIIIFLYNYRANLEENLLIKNLGEEYLNYKNKVKYKFFPYIF